MMYASNMNYDTILNSITSLAPSPKFIPYTTDLLLEILRAYDEQTDKDGELLVLADSLCTWLSTFESEENDPVIENLLSSKFYQAALALALTVPDICGKVEFPKEGVHDRYTKWFALHVEHNFEPVHLPEDENDAAPDYSKRALNGEMCYRTAVCISPLWK